MIVKESCPNGSLHNFLYDVNLLQSSVSDNLANTFRNLLTLICLLGVMFYQDITLSLIALIAIPLVALLSKRLGKRMKKASTGTQIETGVLASLLTENLDGTRIVKAYQQEEAEIKKVSQSIYRRMQLLIKTTKTNCGFDIGKTDANVFIFLLVYTPFIVLFAVPVFPPIS